MQQWGRRLPEMTDVIERFDGLDVETGIAWHLELLAAFVGRPLVFSLEPDAAFPGVELHDFRRAGIENQRRRKNHADGFLGAVGEQDGVRYARAGGGGGGGRGGGGGGGGGGRGGVS